MFFEDFCLGRNVHLTTCAILVAGDFNFHMDVADDVMRDLLDSSSLEQHVTVPTHICNHTLDLVITRTSDDNVICSDIRVDHSLPSDHFAVSCLL